jgi:hypothetical protein
MSRASAFGSWSFCRWLPIKRTLNRSLIGRRGWRRLRRRRQRPADCLCQYLNCSEHLICRPRIVWNENFDDRSGEACPTWVARHEIADGAGEDAKADDRAGLKRPPEYYLLKHISVTQSIHRINSNQMATTSLATPIVYDEPVKAMTIAPDSAAVGKDRQADPAINVAKDRGNLCLLRVALRRQLLEDVGRQLPTGRGWRWYREPTE